MLILKLARLLPVHVQHVRLQRLQPLQQTLRHREHLASGPAATALVGVGTLGINTFEQLGTYCVGIRYQSYGQVQSHHFFRGALATGQVGKSLADAGRSVYPYPAAASRPSPCGRYAALTRWASGACSLLSSVEQRVQDDGGQVCYVAEVHMDTVACFVWAMGLRRREGAE